MNQGTSIQGVWRWRCPGCRQLGTIRHHPDFKHTTVDKKTGKKSVDQRPATACPCGWFSIDPHTIRYELSCADCKSPMGGTKSLDWRHDQTRAEAEQDHKIHLSLYLCPTCAKIRCDKVSKATSEDDLVRLANDLGIGVHLVRYECRCRFPGCKAVLAWYDHPLGRYEFDPGRLDSVNAIGYCDKHTAEGARLDDEIRKAASEDKT
jgi:hypothetical protein